MHKGRIFRVGAVNLFDIIRNWYLSYRFRNNEIQSWPRLNFITERKDRLNIVKHFLCLQMFLDFLLPSMGKIQKGQYKALQISGLGKTDERLKMKEI